MCHCCWLCWPAGRVAAIQIQMKSSQRLCSSPFRNSISLLPSLRFHQFYSRQRSQPDTVNLGKPSPLPHPFIWIYSWTIMEMCGIEKWAPVELKQKISYLLYNLWRENKRAAITFPAWKLIRITRAPLCSPPSPHTTVPFHSFRHQTRAWHMLPHAPAEATLNYQSDCTAAETCQQWPLELMTHEKQSAHTESLRRPQDTK